MISKTKDTLLCNRMTMAHDEAHYIKPMLDKMHESVICDI